MPISITPDTAASIVAAQLINQTNNLIKLLSNSLEEGVTANSITGAPAISAAILISKLGPDAVTKLQAVIVAGS